MSLGLRRGLLAVWLALLLAAPAAGAPGRTPLAWSRVHEAIEIRGDALQPFQVAALDDLFLVKYGGGAWQAIPFQFDEVSTAGDLGPEDGLLDGDDRLVFMAGDLGQRAPAGQWLSDDDARLHLRLEIHALNPQSPAEEGWAYLYRSATLALPVPADYVSWDAANSRIQAGSYVLGFSPAQHPGVESLELNGHGVDVLDRTKVRITATCLIGSVPVLTLNLTEQDLAGQTDLTPTIDGPVRAGRGDARGEAWFYRSSFRSRTVVDESQIEPVSPCTSVDVTALRLSSDWRDPAASGMAPAAYYDANTPAGVPIDGTPDEVAAQPLAVWRQVSGAQGSVVQVTSLALAAGTPANYYLDDQALSSGDTGDGRSFGDAGFVVDGVAGAATAETWTVVLDPAQPPLGAVYQGYEASPLQVTVRAQAAHAVFLPLVIKHD